MNAAQNIPGHIAEQAVHWLIERQEGPLPAARELAWRQWLAAHPEHLRAWEHIQAVNQRLRGVASPLAHAALNAPQNASRRRALKLALLLGVGGAGGFALRQQDLLPPLLADYRSPLGQRRSQALSDGSQLQLNTASAVDVSFTASQRRVRLLEGEMLLASAADPRPLSVTTAQGTLAAQAARFNVRQLAGRTRLAVFSGQVELNPIGLHGYPLIVESGRQVEFNQTGWQASRPLDANSGAWVDGMLVAAHMRLGDFLEELGRYRRGQLHCAASVANLQISGSYPLGDTERILDLLAVALPVKVRRFTRYWVNVEAAS
ncbi:MAG: FecR family protein [Pseudomonas sp.]|uniref:FecR domain-containing protein n=1 Tax=Pseudomonas abieticivorans TaxID=2931382 RepID=UPI0020BF291D|nr:FecR family protein [Pseudomonas sp. PIA16]MDE1164983.1 FecR family protein [Pseudomonas sp.]